MRAVGGVSLSLTMITPFRQSAVCTPSAVSGSYVYSIIPASDRSLVALTSADELFLLDRETLRKDSSQRFSDVPKGATCIVSGYNDRNLVICAGRDGCIVTFDVRSQKKASQFKLGKFNTHLGSYLNPHHQ